MKPIDAKTAKARLHARGEIALLDVREQGQYGEGHPFLAVPCPYSRFENLAPSLVPRRGAPVLLVDDGDGVAERAASALDELGYRDVSWIDGGAPAWAEAGYTLFKGVNLPSKTLGELIELEWRVPHVSADRLDGWRNDGGAFRLFDGRPASEYRKMTIPGSTCFPNGELAHRMDAAIDDETVPVVVNCAGRTRSIIGAAGLKLAGVKNPVYALENGTQGWALSGRELWRGRLAAPLPDMDERAKAASAVRARALAKRCDIPFVDAQHLGLLASDASHTLYMLDVRTADEFAAGSIPGAVWAPAGQLAQATDQWVGVRRARVVLIDDTGLRAAITAVFLRQLNYDVFVFAMDGAKRSPGEIVRADAPAPPKLPRLPSLSAAEAVALANNGGLLIDLRGSMEYRAGHLAGAIWSIRPRLDELPIDAQRSIALAGDEAFVALAAKDLIARGISRIAHVAGDITVWRVEGAPVMSSSDEPSDADAIDHLFFTHRRHDGDMADARRYLAWEMGLVAQLDAQERAEYRIGPGPFDPNSQVAYS
ncbi:rhodanese-like domain-containing protein [Terrarubrum flagellatum]|uniref:rhodanese-like domain-containing protein n=1 Tax=Terrirubrum flagellatum TaxID=2895980 RepID=UPI003144EFDB